MNTYGSLRKQRLIDALWVHLQLDIDVSVEGKSHLKCTLLSQAPIQRRSTEMGFSAYKIGKEVNRPNGFIPYTDHHHILVLKLYWTPEVFEQKELINRLSKRLYKQIKNLQDNNSGWKSTVAAAFSGPDWVFSEYWSFD